ncbi:2OG-Fe(II) oxygenase [Hyphomonas johnsonii]|uniref:2OG-Fe(II) oxygenase n=1 Tax=Hyphomonas johnsonii MHS-2 TaxID=1280950 RepID=A0A059FCI3_9PROT|nr:2OG-Fe(II) oxygenase [Hyphomonas johnsonii]KCZ88335.1 2OG-Fe(II) oxygenase [Hyphomonas johnsonii MHS-2]
MHIAVPLPGDNRLGAIAGDLAARGWSWQPRLLPDDLTAALRAEVLLRDAEQDLDPAGIGREDAFQLDRSVRRTRIAWMDGSSAAQRAFLAWAEPVRESLNRALLIGMFEFEACYVVYPEGGFYDRHLDSFAGARNRVLSLVVYLNEAWQPETGGALAIWPEGADPAAPPVAHIMPEAGGAVFMLSETVPHAVDVTHARRFAIAGWWRVNQSGDTRIDPLT